MDKDEILPMVARFVQKRGYKTSPYAFSPSWGVKLASHEFIVWFDNIRIGVVDFENDHIIFRPEPVIKQIDHAQITLGEPYSYNPYDPSSLPSLIEQINAVRILHRGIK